MFTDLARMANEAIDQTYDPGARSETSCSRCTPLWEVPISELSSVVDATESIVGKAFGNYIRYLSENASHVDNGPDRMDNADDFDEGEFIGKLCENPEDEEFFDSQMEDYAEIESLINAIRVRIVDDKTIQTPQNCSEELSRIREMIQRHQPITNLVNLEHPAFDRIATKLAILALHFRSHHANEGVWPRGDSLWRDRYGYQITTGTKYYRNGIFTLLFHEQRNNCSAGHSCTRKCELTSCIRRNGICNRSTVIADGYCLTCKRGASFVTEQCSDDSRSNKEPVSVIAAVGTIVTYYSCSTGRIVILYVYVLDTLRAAATVQNKTRLHTTYAGTNGELVVVICTGKRKCSTYGSLLSG